MHPVVVQQITRADARAQGLRRYFTGKPCKRGHVAERDTLKKCCIVCRPLDYRAWFDRDYAKNKPKYAAKSKRYYTENYEAVRAQMRGYRQRNITKARAETEAWQKANPERFATSKRNRRARKKQAAGSHSAADISDIFKLQRGLCGYCQASLRRNTPQVDHIVALARGGSNDRRNLQLLCRPCNTAKHATDPIVFARRLGRLL